MAKAETAAPQVKASHEDSLASDAKFTQSSTEPELVPVAPAPKPKSLDERIARIEVILRAQGHDV